MIDVNFWVILAAAVASMVAGAVWYMAFDKVLRSVRTLTPAEEKHLEQQKGPMFGIGFVLTIVMAFVLFCAVTIAQKFYGMSPLWGAVSTALWLYIGFIVPVQASHILFGNYGEMHKKAKLFGINTGAQLVSLIAMSLVIGWLK